MLQLTLKILEFKSGSFVPEGQTKELVYSNAICQFEGREYKIKTSVNLEAFVGKEQDFMVTVTPDSARKPTFVITEVV